MNAEQVHNFKVLMLKNTLEPYKYDYGSGSGDGTVPADAFRPVKSRKPRVINALGAGYVTLSASNARFRRGIVAQFLYVGMQVAVWSFTIRLALELAISMSAMPRNLYGQPLAFLSASLSPTF